MEEELYSLDEALLQRCVNKQNTGMNFLAAKRWTCLLVFMLGLSCSLVAQEVTVEGRLFGAGNEELNMATVRC